MKQKIIASFILITFLLSLFSSFSMGSETAEEKEVSLYTLTNDPDNGRYGLIEPPNWNADENKFNAIYAKSNLPDRFDWRELNGCPSVRDQGKCGSCWAFATTGVLECNIKIKDGLEVNLSEQWLVSCNTYEDEFGRGWGCDGGWYAHDYFMEEPVGNKYVDECGNTGAVLESDFPYGSEDWADTGIIPDCKCPYPHKYFIKDWKYIGDESGNTVDQIKSAILNYGPVTCAVYCDINWANYKGGIFDSDLNIPKINHAVIIVGWDDNQGINGVWFIRNSWGPEWGEDKNGRPWNESTTGGGYMRIEYGANNIGHSANYIVYEPEKQTIDLDFEMHKIKALDDIEQNESEGEADWSYQVSVLQDEEWITVENNYYSENQDIITKDVNHEFEVTEKVVPIKIKVWDRDEDEDDLADASSYEGGGMYNDTSDRRGATFFGKYNILDHKLMDDFEDAEIDLFDENEGYYSTSGIYDEGENDLDVEVWFKIEDGYSPPIATIQGESDVVEGRALISYGNSVGGTAPFIYEWDLNNNGIYGELEDAEGTMTYNSWPTVGAYTINFRVIDGFEQTDEISKTIEVTENQAPITIIEGPTNIRKGTTHTWNISATDPDGDQVRLWIQYPNDKKREVEWSENYYDSGEKVTYTASFDGPYLSIDFNAKAKDIDNLEGKEANLKVTFPKSKEVNYRFISFIKQMNFMDGMLTKLLSLISK